MTDLQKSKVPFAVEFSSLRRLAPIVLFAFSLGFFLPGVDASCPDGDSADHSCSPVCPCVCCPGHGIGLMLFTSPADSGLCVMEVDHPPFFHVADICDQDFVDRIFHPPRV